METMPLGIVVERRILTSAWQEEAWRPVAVLPGAPAACWRLLDEEPGRTRYLAAVLPLELHRSDAASYRENLLSDTPAVFVSLRRDGGEAGFPYRPLACTVAPDEGQSLSEAGDEVVEAVPMPPLVQAWVRDFVDRNYIEEPFRKRKRKGLEEIEQRPRRP